VATSLQLLDSIYTVDTVFKKKSNYSTSACKNFTFFQCAQRIQETLLTSDA